MNTHLPELCFALVACHKPGERIVVIKRGESGFYTTDADQPHLSVDEARALTDYLNRRIDVDKAHVQAMVTGSMFGWDVPGANPAKYLHLNESTTVH